ncbi:MAG: helix-hairpin-helix domain-containing protein [Candidatus Thorarchaeota archaeon]
MQDLLEKKWDLNYLYDMTQQALEAGDIDQAAKLSKKGREESKLHAEKGWLTKFKELSHVIKKLKYSNNSIEDKGVEEIKLDEDLTKLKGISPTHELKLTESGYNTIEKIAKSNPKTLAFIKGIGIESAKQFILSAREYLEISHLNENINKMQTTLCIQSTNNNSTEFESKKDSTELKKTEFKLNELLYQRGSNKAEASYQNYLKEKVLTSKIKEISETSSSKKKIMKKLALKGYFSIPLETNYQLQDIDELIFKEVSFRQNQHMIFIFPFKFAQIDDILVVSEDSIYYQNQKENNLMINNFAANLTKALHNIIENIASKGTLFEYIQKFLKFMEVNQNFYECNEVLLHSSGTHYLIHVDPILISLSDVKFLEKSIPFAYQKNSNIHFIQETQIIKLIQFLEKKHKFIGKYNTAQKVEDIHNQANNKFQKQLLRYSLIPFSFGALAITIALTQIPYLLLPFIGLSYVVLCFYTAIIGYLYYIFKIKRKNIRDQYMIPSYQRPIALEEASLEIIYRDLIDDLMLQFGYECFGKSNQYKLLNKIEQKTSNLMIKNQLLKPQGKILKDLCEQEEDKPRKNNGYYYAKVNEFLAE